MTLDQRIKEIKERMEKIPENFYYQSATSDTGEFIEHSRSDIEFLVKALEIAIDKISSLNQGIHYEMCFDHSLEECLKDEIKEIEDLAK